MAINLFYTSVSCFDYIAWGELKRPNTRFQLQGQAPTANEEDSEDRAEVNQLCQKADYKDCAVGHGRRPNYSRSLFESSSLLRVSNSGSGDFVNLKKPYLTMETSSPF